MPPVCRCPLAQGPAVSTAPAPATARTRTRTRTGLHCSRQAPPPVAIHVVLLLLVVVVVVVAATVMAGLQRTTTWMLPLGFCCEEALLGGWSYPPWPSRPSSPSRPLTRARPCSFVEDYAVLYPYVLRCSNNINKKRDCRILGRPGAVHFQHTAVSWAQPFHSPP